MTRKTKSPDTAPDSEAVAASQGPDEYKVGPGHPPKEHQFKPGQSGNPKGPPKSRTYLWKYLCDYMAMTDEERAKIDLSKLTAVQQTAFTIVESAAKGEGCKAERLMRYIVDREEGKAAEHLILDNGADLSDEECDEVRKLILQNQAGEPDGRDTD